jgi:hypothetical protein
MPGTQLEIDAATPIDNEGFHLLQVFRTVEIDRGWGHYHQTGLTAQWDMCLGAPDMPA